MIDTLARLTRELDEALDAQEWAEKGNGEYQHLLRQAEKNLAQANLERDGYASRAERAETECERLRAALLDKATPGPWDDCGAWVTPSHRKFTESRNENAALIVAAVNTLPALIAHVRELEQQVQACGIRPRGKSVAPETIAAAFAMRERAARACEELSAEWSPRDKHDAARERTIMRCAAAVRALEP